MPMGTVGPDCVRTQNPLIFRGIETLPDAEKIDYGAIVKAEFQQHLSLAEFLHSLGQKRA